MMALHEAILLLFAFLLFTFFLRGRRSTKHQMLPPSPRKLPIIGNLHQLGKFPHRSLHSLSNRYGHLMLLHFGKVPVVVASSAAAATEIMKNQDLIFSNRPTLSVPDRLVYGSRDVAFAAYGDYWRQMRSICVLHLLSNKRVQSFCSVREEETSFLIERIDRSRHSSTVVNLTDELVTTTNDIICRVALGRKYGGEEKSFKKFMKEFIELLGALCVGEFIPWLAWVDGVVGLDAKVARVHKLFDEFLEDVVQEHRHKSTEKVECVGDDLELDLVDILLQLQRENKSNSPVEDQAIKALIMDIFAAGTDTTSTALEWGMTELIRNPRTMNVLQNEVRKVVGNKKEIEEDDIENMPYLRAVVKESLRLHAPLPLLVPRESVKDTKILGYDIRSGTRIFINVWTICRDPSIWENPQEFYPERFLNTDVNFKGLHFEFVPFGAGRRGCPGISFAVAAIELAIAKLVHKFNFALPNGQRGEDLDMTEANGITISKKLPLLVVVEKHC